MALVLFHSERERFCVAFTGTRHCNRGSQEWLPARESHSHTRPPSAPHPWPNCCVRTSESALPLADGQLHDHTIHRGRLPKGEPQGEGACGGGTGKIKYCHCCDQNCQCCDGWVVPSSSPVRPMMMTTPLLSRPQSAAPPPPPQHCCIVPRTGQEHPHQPLPHNQLPPWVE